MPETKKKTTKKAKRSTKKKTVKKAETKNNLGRPSKYKEEYCDALVKHMGQGLSFESFAAEVDAHKDTLYEWLKHHEAFSDAKRRGTMRSLNMWEKIGVAGAVGTKNVNAALWRLNMQNRFGWTDKREVTADVTTHEKDQLSEILKDKDAAKAARLLAEKLSG